jgi:hypothetical protein
LRESSQVEKIDHAGFQGVFVVAGAKPAGSRPLAMLNKPNEIEP